MRGHPDRGNTDLRNSIFLTRPYSRAGMETSGSRNTRKFFRAFRPPAPSRSTLSAPSVPPPFRVPPLFRAFRPSAFPRSPLPHQRRPPFPSAAPSTLRLGPSTLLRTSSGRVGLRVGLRTGERIQRQRTVYRGQSAFLWRTPRATKTDVIVLEAGAATAAVGTPSEPSMVVPRATPLHLVLLPVVFIRE